MSTQTKDYQEEVEKCTACGAIDSIYFTSDAGVCMECGTPENYKTIILNEEEDES